MKEIVADRTATSSTWRNSNGSLTVRRYLAPHFYKSASGGWLPINPVLAPTAGKPGWWHAVATDTAVAFGPAGAAGGDEQVSVGAAHVGFAPLAVSDPSLAPVVAGATATYPGLWPETTVTEQVTAGQVTENVVLASPGAPVSFSFRLLGATARPDAAGGLEVLTGGRQAGVIPAPVVTRAVAPQLRSGMPAGSVDVTAASRARLTVAGDVVTVSVSKSWLAGLPASAFPVVIDPTFEDFNVGASQLISVSNTGQFASGMGTGVDSSGLVWRGAAYMPAPAPPAQEPGNPEPWQLSVASIFAGCSVTDCLPSGLSGLGVYGLTASPTFADIPAGVPIDVNPPSSDNGFVATDMSTFMRKAKGGWVGVVANQPGDLYTNLVIFNPSMVYADWQYVEQPPPTTISSPVNHSVLATATPTLTASAVTDPDGSPQYDFKISTTPGGTGAIADSGWLNNPTWTVPPGFLQDGVTYYATVQTAISQQFDTASPNWVPPGAATSTDTFTVKERLGSGGPSPTDTVGSPPQGATTPSQGAPSPGLATASETVNMVTGNLAVDVTTPSMQALSGNAGITLAYNSASSATAATGSTNYGLLGQYYTYATDANGIPAFTGTLVSQRTDSNVDQNWGSSPPVGGLSQFQPFMVKWKGFITLPQGTWAMGGLTTGGMRVLLNGSTVYDNWSGNALGTSPTFGTVTVSGSAAQVPIEVDDWDNGNTGQTTVQLWAENTAVTDPTVQNLFMVPPGWLTASPDGVPPGWSLQANAASVLWTHADDQGSQVVLSDAGGDTATFTRTGTSASTSACQSSAVYQSPPGDTDYLTAVSVNGACDLQLSTSSNQLYTFNADGSLKSMTTIDDDLHPAALEYTYSGSPAVLSSIYDPVSQRSITLSYGGSCPGSMLCTITYWDNSSTTFGYNANGQLASVTDPGNQITEFAYDSDNRLAGIQDPLASAYLADGGQVDPAESCATGTGLTVSAADTQICYDSSGRVAMIKQPEPSYQGLTRRPARFYTYGTGTTSMSIAGFFPASGYAEQVSYDSQDRITSKTNSAGLATTTVWDNAAAPGNTCGACGADESLATVIPAGLQTSTVYDADGNVTDSYGPAPVACFDPSTWPTGVTPPAAIPGYLPVADPQGTTGCGVAVPHTHKGYDEGMSGLAETFWSNGQFAGAAAAHGTGDSSLSQQSSCTAGNLCSAWTNSSQPAGVGYDASGHWTLRLTGTINLPVAGSYGFAISATQPTTLSVDGTQILTDIPAIDGQFNSVQVSGLNLSAGMHQIEVGFKGYAGSIVNAFGINYTEASLPCTGGPWCAVPDSWLGPAYGLKTSVTDPDGVRTSTSYSDPSTGMGPEYGLPTSTTIGAGSSTALTTTTKYEAPGVGFLRKLSTTLPGGNATAYQYYGGTDAPTAAACGVADTTPQGGRLASLTDPAPAAGAPAREQQFIYDAQGRQAGVRTGPSQGSNSVLTQPWQCTSYDALGRITSQTWPATSTAPARTVTYSYSVGGNPLVNSVTDSNGTITSTVDLLGRATSYTDASGQTTQTFYDQAGRVSMTISAAGTIADFYDNNSSQLTEVDLNGTLLASAQYDASTGRLVYVSYGGTDQLGKEIFYDSYGNVNQIRYVYQGFYSAIMTATYDAAGRITGEGLNYLTEQLPQDLPYTYDGAGRLSTAMLLSGQQATYSYGAESSSCPSGTNPDAGANTNRTQVTVGTTTTDYCYNSADQLTATITGATTNSNYAYDGRGNQKSDGANTVTWDASDRTSSIATASGSTTNLTYDALNRVISRDTNGTTTGYWYDGYSDAPAGTLNSSGQVTQSFISLPGGVTVTVRAPANTWSYPDLQGNTILTSTDGSTHIFNNGPTLYDPWGALLSVNPYIYPPANPPINNVDGGSDLGAYGSDGKVTDLASGIVTMGARAYNPGEGRFLSVDPQQGGCSNAYVYASGDPLKNPDLNGQNEWGNACVAAGGLNIVDAIQFVYDVAVGVLEIEFPPAAEILIEIGFMLTSAAVGALQDAHQQNIDTQNAASAVSGLEAARGSGELTDLDREHLAQAYSAGILKFSLRVNSYYQIGQTQYYIDCWEAGLPYPGGPLSGISGDA